MKDSSLKIRIWFLYLFSRSQKKFYKNHQVWNFLQVLVFLSLEVQESWITNFIWVCFLLNQNLTIFALVSKSPSRPSFTIIRTCFLSTFGSWTQFFLSCIRKKSTSTFEKISKLDNFEIWLVNLCFRKYNIFRNHFISQTFIVSKLLTLHKSFANPEVTKFAT